MKYFRSVILSFIALCLWPDCVSGAAQDTVQTLKQRDSLAERVTIRSINLSGNKHTRRSIILREMSIQEGENVAADSLEQLLDVNHKRLFNLSLFTDIHLSFTKWNDSAVDLNIRLKEQWYIFPEVAFQLADRNFNVWWTEQNRDIRRANARLTLKHKNFRGNMETLGVTAQIGYTQRFAIEYFKPYIDRLQRHGLGFSAAMSKNEEIFYITDSNKLRFVKTPRNYVIREYEGALTYTYRPAYQSRHMVELRYKDVEIDDTLIRLNPEYFENGSTQLQMLQLLYRWELNKVDNWNYPLVGYKIVNHTAARFGFKGFRFQTFSSLETGYFKKFGKKWFTSNVFRGRVTLPVDQPYILRNALGTGSEYIRGYEYYVTDGSQYGLLRNNLKYEALNIVIRDIPLKYLPVIPLRLYPKVFVDAGYVANRYPRNSFLNNRLLYSAGVGLDIVSAYDFKLRLEYTWNHLGEKGLFLHINSE